MKKVDMFQTLSKYIIHILSLILFLSSISEAEPRSIYVLQHNRRLRVFKISDDELEFQAKLLLLDHGLGPIGVAIDDEAKIIFISFEGIAHEEPGNVIEIYNTSLCHIETVKLTGPGDIAGLVFDKAGSRLIAGERGDNRIWLIDWDGQTLTLDTTPSYADLEGIQMSAILVYFRLYS